MGVYDRQIATALRLIEKYGQQCEVRKSGVAVPDDPHRPWLGGEAPPQVHTPHIAFVPATSGASSFGMTKFRDRDANSASFSTFGLMGAQDFTPQVTDQLSRDGQPLVIVAVDTLSPNGEPILHILSIV